MKFLTRSAFVFLTAFVLVTAVYADMAFYVKYAVEGGNIYFDSLGGIIADCDSGVTKAAIPAEIKGVAVTAIDSLAFRSCDSLISVEIPASVTSIGNGTLSGGSLTNISVDSGNQQYASAGGVLFNKSKTVLIRYPIGKQETSYQIPVSVTSIGDWAFSGWGNLTSVEIPASVTSIGDWAFSGCDNLTSVEIPASVISIGNNAFSGCKSLTGVEIPFGVASIGKEAFSLCDALTSVEIPASVTSIGGAAFSGGRMANISVDSANQQYASVDGILFNKSQTALICYPRGRWDVSSYQIPVGVTSIEDSAFFGCYDLTSVEIPSSVTSIENEAFSSCGSLTSVEIPSRVTSIGDSAFFDCHSLTSVKIPASVTSIGSQAFDWCDNLRDVYYGGSKEQWDAIDGINNSKLISDSITIHYNVSMPDTPTAPEFAASSAPTVGGRAIRKADLSGLTEISVPLSISADTPTQVTLCVPFFDGGKFLGMGFVTATVDKTTQSVSVPVTGNVSGAEKLKVIFVDADFRPLSATGFDIAA